MASVTSFLPQPFANEHGHVRSAEIPGWSPGLVLSCGCSGRGRAKPEDFLRQRLSISLPDLLGTAWKMWRLRREERALAVKHGGLGLLSVLRVVVEGSSFLHWMQLHVPSPCTSGTCGGSSFTIDLHKGVKSQRR